MQRPSLSDLGTAENAMIVLGLPLWVRLGMPHTPLLDDSPDALTFRAICCLLGLGGCSVDPRKARRLLLKAEAQGSAAAFLVHAKWLVWGGFGETTDNAEALFQEAFNRGLPDGLIYHRMSQAIVQSLGDEEAGKLAEALMEEYGRSKEEFAYRVALVIHEVDPKRGRVWMQKALDCGSSQAHYDMAKYLLEDGMEAGAVEMMEVGAAQGNISCAGWLARRLCQTVPRQPEEVRRLLSYTQKALPAMVPSYLGCHAFALVSLQMMGDVVDETEVIRCAIASSMFDGLEGERSRELLAPLLYSKPYLYSREAQERFVAHWLFAGVAVSGRATSIINVIPLWKRWAFTPGLCKPWES